MASEIKRRFTDTEMQIAKETDLPELLTHLGYQVRRIGRYHTTAEMDSLRIKDRRKWFRYSQNTGGDAITFLQQFCGKSFSEAVEYLLAFHGRARDSPTKAAPSVKRDEVQKGFRGDVTGSDKRVGFALPYDRSSDQVLVFEAPIDLMSYLTLHRNTPNALALCGLYDGALQAYLADHPQIKRIELCLDADGPGREAARQFQDKYTAMGYAVTVEEPRSGKDWNEYLQKRKTPERGR